MSPSFTPECLNLARNALSAPPKLPASVRKASFSQSHVGSSDQTRVGAALSHQCEGASSNSQTRPQIQHLLKNINIQLLCQNYLSRGHRTVELCFNVDHERLVAVPLFKSLHRTTSQAMGSASHMQRRFTQAESLLPLRQVSGLLSTSDLILGRPDSPNDCRNRAHGLHPCSKVLRTLGPEAIQPRVRGVESKQADRTTQRQHQHAMLIEFDFDFHISLPKVPGGSKA